MSKKYLYDILKALMEGNDVNADKAFSNFANVKGRKIIKESTETFGGEPGEYADMENDGAEGGPVQYTAPSAWASYFINGDASGLEDDEQKAADTWLNDIGLGSPVDCEDAGFIKHHDAYNVCPYAADCQSYTFHT